MDYLVSVSTDFNIEGYKRVSSLDEVVVADASSVIVIHSFHEDEYKGSLAITDLYRKRGIHKFIYITSDPLDSVRMLVESIGGVFEDDEYLLTDKDEIDVLVSLIDQNSLEVIENNMPSVHTGFEVMNDFLVKFESGDSSLNDPLYLEVVNRAVGEIRQQVRLQEEKTELMGRGVIETYENTLDVINKLYKEAEDIRQKLDEVDRSSKEIKLGRVEPLNYYPPITYAGNTPLVVFKEISSCRYLTSFVLAYANHLQTVKSMRVRVLIVTGKQPLVKNRYSSMFELTKDNYQTGQAIIETVAYTSTPIKSLILHLTKQSDEIILVVDRTYEKEPIVKGKATILYGVSGRGEVLRENLDVSKCIFSMRGLKGSLATITHIVNFPEDVDNRLNKYEIELNSDFNRLDELLI